MREDGQVDMHELQIGARSGVVYLEGAVPSEAEYDVLLNILTDIAGIQEIVDNLDVQRLAWERNNRSKVESAQERQPARFPIKNPMEARKTSICQGGRRDLRAARSSTATAASKRLVIG